MASPSKASALSTTFAGLLCAATLGLASDAVAAPSEPTAKKWASQGPGQLRGVNLTPNWEYEGFGPLTIDDATAAAEMRAACELGATTVRFVLRWSKLEPAQGRIEERVARRIDQVMTSASACGIRVIVTLVFTPCWATSDPATLATIKPPATVAWCRSMVPFRHPPREVGWYGSIVERVLARWPGIHALEVWNEPNLELFWRGSPGQYAALANAAVQAAERVGSSTLILAGALAGASSDYLTQLYAAGMRGHDGISVHPYDFSAVDPSGYTRMSRWKRLRSGFQRQVKTARRTMLAAGDKTKGLWLTEFGYSVCPTQPRCVTEARQGKGIARSFRFAAGLPYVRGLTAFSLRDMGDDGAVEDNRFGLLARDFSPRPSFTRAQRTLRSLRRGK